MVGRGKEQRTRRRSWMEEEGRRWRCLDPGATNTPSSQAKLVSLSVLEEGQALVLMLVVLEVLEVSFGCCNHGRSTFCTKHHFHIFLSDGCTMALSRKPVNSNRWQPRAQSSGLVAFDHKQREKQRGGSAADLDPFPSITSLASAGLTKNVRANHCTHVKTSSVVGPSLQFRPPADNYKGVMSEKHRNKQIMAETIVNPVKLLSNTHSWAKKSLIRDILAAVNNDVDQASILLRAMVSPDAEVKESALSRTSSSTSRIRSDSKNKCSRESGLVENKSDVVEPEYQVDDVYLSHRKDAIKMMRTASEHSQAAKNAFLRGDHVSAQHHSSRAKEGWTAAQKLNAEAASEILRIKNINNDEWKLDLHGLHAKEAVSALKDHLHKIESQTATRHSTFVSKLIAALKALCCLDVDMKTKENNVMGNQRLSVLDIITGRGSHSREGAVLPGAVRSFLIDNGYRFENVRPGVIGVHPKLRGK